jgi:uncharacterized protein YbjT (DUF2867 family)
MTKKTIAVHGATGSQGAPVAALLAAAGHTVKPVARSTGADLLDRASLQAAYADADAVVLHLPLVYDERALQMGENVARAAEAAGVGHLVINASGGLPPEPIGMPWVDARHRAAAAEVPRVTVLQPTMYLENLNTPWSAERVAHDGVVAYRCRPRRRCSGSPPPTWPAPWSVRSPVASPAGSPCPAPR